MLLFSVKVYNPEAKRLAERQIYFQDDNFCQCMAYCKCKVFNLSQCLPYIDIQ